MRRREQEAPRGGRPGTGAVPSLPPKGAGREPGEQTDGGAVDEMVGRIVARFDPLSVVLFGSRARGEAGPGSDVDLLVVMPEGSAADNHRATVEILRALKDVPVPKDVVVTTPEEIERRGDLVGTVLRPALREGKVLYERA